ncbi:MAG: glycosyltransferase family 1 protein [Kordiimonadaceae bacterium]|nr:glycosyltransferase family 1 protein [Kordiimonadaceae bacterium]MBO6568830.1 glycosyltransferase family 1 protein [Kordiimonadaceae bacterium]MBO6965195.1 glycosyltransferase family 1 protein [Kordiimonadaceae bacterium]
MPFELTRFEPRRIALFSGNYNYVMDGPVRALNKLVAYLEARGVEVLVFAPTAKKAAFDHSGTLVSVPSIAIPGRGEYRVALGMPKAIRQRLEAFKPDLIHLAAPDWLGHAALSWAEKNSVPAVASFHTRFDTYPRYYHMAWLEKHVTAFMRRFYHRCEQIYVPSPCMAQELAEQDMSPNIGIWSRGVDSSLFNPDRRDMAWRRQNGIEDDEITIAFVGRLVLEKGLGVFADTLDLLKQRGMKVRALVVGEGPERERFETRLPDAVFTGYLNGEDLARAYASSNIFFNASVTETFGNVTLEAMACGLPLVCADATGSRSLVDQGVNGYLAKEVSAEAFADDLAKIITNPSTQQKMAAASHTSSKAYTWDAILGRLYDQYQDVLAGYSSDAPDAKRKSRGIASVKAAE